MNEPDLTPFWCLMVYDQDGARMYAYGEGGPFDPSHRYPSTTGGLAHRPHEARKFASREEAEAALPTLAPWIEAYVRDYQRRDPKSKFAVRLPLQPYFERDLVHIYPDGSGLASEQVRRNMAWIAEEEDMLRTLRAFTQKHLARLEGISWSVSCWKSEGGPSVTFSSSASGYCSCRGKHVQSEDIAAIWPVEWRRKTPRYPESGWLEYDWVAQLDGVTLRIPIAERTRLAPPPPSGLDGTKVRFGKAVPA